MNGLLLAASAAALVLSVGMLIISNRRCTRRSCEQLGIQSCDVRSAPASRLASGLPSVSTHYLALALGATWGGELPPERADCGIAWLSEWRLMREQSADAPPVVTLHPEDAGFCLREWGAARRHGTNFEAEYRLQRGSDAAFRWYVGRAVPIRDAGGHIVQWFGTCSDIDSEKRAAEIASRLAEQTRLNATLEQDIRARKRAEAALRASDERFRQIEEHSPIGLAIIGLDGSMQRVNAALCGLTGYTRDQLLYRDEITHPDDRSRDIELSRSLIDGTRSAYEIEKRYIHNDGHVVWIQLSASVVRDEHGEPLYLIGQVHDISARRALHESTLELRQSEQRYRTLTDAMPQLVGIIDAQDAIRFTNEQWGAYFGLTDALVSAPEHGLPMQANVEAARTVLATMRATGQAGAEVPLRRGDGELRWHSLRLAPLTFAQGASAHWIFTCSDIQNQKEFEASLKEKNRLMGMAEELAHLDHWRIDAASLATTWSAQIDRIRGLHPTPGPTIEGGMAAYHREDVENIHRLVQRAMTDGEPFACEVRAHRSDGLRCIASTGQAERSADGRIVALFGVTQDVTELRAVERERDALLERITIATNAGCIGVWQWDICADELIWDDITFTIFGRARQSTTHRSEFFLSALHPHDRARIAELFAGVPDELDQQFRVIWPDGEIRHIRAKGKAVRDRQGDPIRLIGASWDVTDFQRMTYQLEEDKTLLAAANVALDAGERRYRSLTDALPQLVAVLDAHAHIVYANRQWSDYTGVDATSLVGGPLDVFHPDDRGAAATSIEALTFTSNVEFEARIRDCRGTYRWHHARIVPLSGEHDAAGHRILTLTDIETRKAAELVLLEQNRLMSMAEKLAHVGHWRVDLTTNEIFWSDEVYRAYGLSTTQAPTLDLAIDAYHPDDREHIGRLVAEAIQSGSAFTHESRIIRTDGVTRYIVSSGQVERGVDGEPAAIVGVFQDVTDVREAERERARLLQRITLATQAGKIGIWEWDLQTDLHVWDRHQYALYGLPEHEAPQPSDLWRLAIHHDDLPLMAAAIERALLGDSFDLGFRIRWPNGELRYLQGIGTVVRDAAGTPTRMVGTNWDVTEVRLLAEELRAEKELLAAAKEAADEANRAKSNFLARMSHEIRTPLNGVIGLTAVVLDSTLTPEQHRYMTHLQDAGTSLMAIINDVLDFSKLDAEKVELERIPLEPRVVFESALAIVSREALSRGLNLRLELAPNIPGWLCGDPTRLRQIVLNLLTNAIKFTEQGGVTISVAYCNAKQQLDVTVADTGIGIPAERMYLLFAKSSHKSTRRRRASSGAPAWASRSANAWCKR